jgi:4-amino-4-deoxy-L-arabinose transferase-like glycosyltransferase
VVLGLLLGILGWTIWDKPVSLPEPIAWSSEVRWVSAQEPGFRFYARRTFDLPAAPQAAWLRLSADNNFILYVNGHVVSRQVSTQNSSLGLASRLSPKQTLNEAVEYRVKTSNYFVGYPNNWKLAAYVDLTDALKPGRNVIALEVQKARQDPRFVVEGAVYTTAAAAPTVNLSTGATRWLASPWSENQRGLLWYQPNFPDQHWAEAKVLEVVTEPIYSRVSQHLFERPLEANWITGIESDKGEIWLRGVWSVPAAPQRALMRLAGDHPFDLLINGLFVQHFAGGEPDLHLYEVTNLLHRGSNILAVRLSRPLTELKSNRPLGLLLDGWIEDQNKAVAVITTNSDWITLAEPTPGWTESAQVQGQPALLLKSPMPQTLHRQFEGDAYLLNYPNYLRRAALWCLAGIGFSLAYAGVLGQWSYPAVSHWQRFGTGAALLLPGTLFLVGIGLLKHRYAEVERGLWFLQPQSNHLIGLGFVSITGLTLLWHQRAHQQDNAPQFAPPRAAWKLLFLLGASGFASFSLATEATLSLSGRLLGAISAGVVALTQLSNWRFWQGRNWLKQPALSRFQKWEWLLLSLIIAIGFCLRAYNLEFTARDSDENTSLDAIRGILRTGAPIATSGIWYTRGPLFHYLTALWLHLLGDTEYNARLLSVLLGTATLLLSFVLAKQVTGKGGTALLITAILAIDSWELLYSRNIRFYQLLQFLSVSTFILFWQGFVERKGRAYQYGFFVVLTLMLLTQEVSITLVPCFWAGVLIFYRPFSLAKDWGLVLGSLITLGIYIFNGIVFKILCLTPWVLLSSTTETQLKLHVWNLTGFISVFFLGSSRMYTIYSCFFILGFIYFLKIQNHKITFLFSSIFLTIIVVTLLVLQIGARYAYSIYPLFIILAIHSLIEVTCALGSQLGRLLNQPIFLSKLSICFALLLLFSSLEIERVLMGYQDALARHNPQVFEYIRAHKQPGDVVFANLSSAAAIALGGLDYYMPPEQVLRVDALYVRDGRLVDRWGGGESVISVDQMRQVLETANRVWLQLDDSKPPSDPILLQLYNYIQSLGQPVLETYGVRLRLWQKQDGFLPSIPNRGQDLGNY